MTKFNSKSELAALQSLADESLRSAELMLKEGFYRGAVNDSYYAAFYAAKAALLVINLAPKTHKGTARLFGDNYVKMNKIDRKYGKWLNRLLEERTEATYDAMQEFDEKEANNAVEMAGEFVAEVKKVLGNLGG